MNINSFQPTRDESGFEPPTAKREASNNHEPPAFLPNRPSYIRSLPYLEYRARPRREIGEDGEIVWSDEIEDAFQLGQFSLSRICWSFPLTFWVLCKNSPQ
ncbi:unnamed protein product [Penicillium salamii]|uniref:Uncharacterized protein n=1 Tax=Penicillium salamii TaxID=1612424 RepID=A0A9W4IET7_9EURO|nr:unnamed protein product [Penicillium salamii]